jgi:hypothetical protein
MAISEGKFSVLREADGKRLKNGASEGIRTLDTHVGNVMLYQAELRSRPKARKNYGKSPELQALFFWVS